MAYWKCIKTLTMEVTKEVAFTEGKVYLGHVSATPLGEWALAFTDDTGFDNHLMTSEWLHGYFVSEPMSDPKKEACRLFLDLSQKVSPEDDPDNPVYRCIKAVTFSDGSVPFTEGIEYAGATYQDMKGLVCFINNLDSIHFADGDFLVEHFVKVEERIVKNDPLPRRLPHPVKLET